MAFRIRDLIITVLPKGSPDPFLCGGPSCGGETIHEDGGGGDGGGGGGGDGGCACANSGCTRIQCSNFPTNQLMLRESMDVKAAELLVLKTDLKLALQKIEAQELATQQQVETPITGPQLNLLEKSLQEALQELRSKRRSLGKAKPGESQPRRGRRPTRRKRKGLPST